MLTDNDLKSYIKSYLQDRKWSYTKLDKHDRAIDILIKENEQLHSIIKEVKLDIEVIEQLEDIEVIKMQLRNIIFRLKDSDKE